MNSRPNKKTRAEKARPINKLVPPAGKFSPPASSPLLKPDPEERWKVAGICIFLAAIVWVVFGQTLHHQFVNFDDDKYIYENPIVQKGLTWEGFRWAFTYGAIGHWHPLTWLTHMLDCQLYGLNPAGHHLTNVLLHMASAVLLFLVLRQMTGYLWRCAFVAAVFAIHPLRAESVAWISERKDVLSAFFFMLTLGAYVRYVRKPSALHYSVVAICFTLGLLSKNMLMTVPFVLLLLDYWPLHRLSSPAELRRRVCEKIPLFLLMLGSCVATALVPEHARDAIKLPFVLRMENAVTSYVIYLWQLIHPFNLVCLYPNPAHLLPLGQVMGALALLLLVSGAVFVLRKNHPYLLIGWLWYLGMMVPVIGLVQLSYMSHADRYTYLTEIGICVALVWLVAGLPMRSRRHRVLLGAISVAIIAWLAFSAQIQTSFWQDGLTLWSHTIAHTSNNPIAHSNYGKALLNDDRIDEAVEQYEIAMQLNPNDAQAHANLGMVLLQKGQIAMGTGELQTAVRLGPDDAMTFYSLGDALLKSGRPDEAIGYLHKSLQIEPDHSETHFMLGIVLSMQMHPDEALAEYRKALQLAPKNAAIILGIGIVFQQKGDLAGAKEQFEQALQIDPENPDVQNRLAWVLATAPQSTLRDGARALKLAQSANASASGKNPIYLRTLAAAYAEVARYDDAQQAIAGALARARSLGQTSLAQQLERDAQLYSSGTPLHHDVR